MIPSTTASLGKAIGGALIVYLAVVVSRPITNRLASASGPRSSLLWNTLLVVAVLVALAGVALIGAAIR